MYFISDPDRCQRRPPHSGPGAKTVKRRMSDSSYRSGDCPTTTWCEASLTVLKETPALRPLTRVRGQSSVIGSGVSVRESGGSS